MTITSKFRSIALAVACVAALGVSGTAFAGSSARDVDGDGVADAEEEQQREDCPEGRRT